MADIESIVLTLTKQFEKELQHERQLRAEVEKLNEHLHDQVSEFRRKLQGRDEPHREYVVFKPRKLSDSERDTIGTKVSSSGTYPSINWLAETDDTL